MEERDNKGRFVSGIVPWNKNRNLTYEEMYGEKEAKKIKANIKKSMNGKNKGEKNGMYGKVPWNKGLTKTDDERIKKYAEKKKHGIWGKEKEVISLYEEGKSTRALGILFNCTHKTIGDILRNNNIKIRNQSFYALGKPSPNKLYLPEKEIINMYNQNIPGTEIGKKYGCVHNVIHKILKKNGINIKQAGFYIKGRIQPEEEIEKRKVSLKKLRDERGYVNSPEARKKMSKGLKIAHKRGDFDNAPIKIKKTLKRLHKEGKLSSPNQCKGKTYEEMYGEEKAKELKNKMSKRASGEKNYFYGKHFCGEENPSWMGGISFEPYDLRWNNKFKRAIRKRDNQVCMNCGIHREELSRALDVHHVNYDKKMTIPQNCISLCRKCHALTLFNREYWTKLFQKKLSILYNYQFSEDMEVLLNK